MLPPWNDHTTMPSTAIGGDRLAKQPAIYIMANYRNGTLYVGVTSDLIQRVWQHRESTYAGFSDRYGCKTLVYFELLDGMVEAIEREKQIKAGTRARKIALIEKTNPTWRDLYEDVI